MAKSAISKKPVEAKAAASKDVKEKKAKKSKKEPTPPPVPSSSSEDESEDSEEESKAAQVKTIPAKAGAEESSSEEESDDKQTPDAEESSDNDEESSEDEEEAVPAPAVADKKRKAAVAEDAPQEKKAKPAHVKPLKTPTELSSNPPSKTLWIGNLSWNVDQPFLASEFESFGKIAGVRIQMDRETGRSRGIGYVEFEDEASAKAAFDAGNGGGMVIDGREVRVDFATQRDPNPEGRAKAFGDKRNPPAATLWVGNLSFELSEDGLHEAFSEHGSVSSVRMPTGPDGAPKGFAYVEFAEVDQATAALEALNGKPVEGRNVRIDYAPPRTEGGGRGGFGGDRGGGRGGFGGDRGGGRGGFGGGRGGGRGGFDGDRGGRGGGRGGGFGGGRGRDSGFAGRGRGGDRGRGDKKRFD